MEEREKIKYLKKTQPRSYEIKQHELILECIEWAAKKGITYEDQVRYVLFHVSEDKRVLLSHTSKNAQVYYLGHGHDAKQSYVGKFKNPAHIFRWAKQF
jgi:hypothetical protein